MAIAEQDIGFYQSAQSPSIGGVPIEAAVPQGIDLFFGNVDFDEATVGSTHYRCFYIANVSIDDTLFEAGIYISVRTPNPSTMCELGLGAAGLNGDETATADQTVAPAGVTFEPTAIDLPLVMGDLGPGDYYPVWVKRIVAPNAAGSAADRLVMTIIGDRGTLVE